MQAQPSFGLPVAVLNHQNIFARIVGREGEFRTISVPTIGIGSGDGCDGQILVTHDLVDMFPWFTPRFVKPRANCAAEIKPAVAAWKQSVEAAVRV